MSLLRETFLGTFDDSLTKSVTGIFPWLKTHGVFLRTAAKAFSPMEKLLHSMYKRTRFDLLALI